MATPSPTAVLRRESSAARKLSEQIVILHAQLQLTPAYDAHYELTQLTSTARQITAELNKLQKAYAPTIANRKARSASRRDALPLFHEPLDAPE